MQAERAPVLGIAIAIVLLVGECIGLVAYTQYRQEQAAAYAISAAQRARAQAVQDAIAAKAKLDALLNDLEKIDRDIKARPDCQLPSQEELQQQRRRLKELRLEQERLRQILSRRVTTGLGNV